MPHQKPNVPAPVEPLESVVTEPVKAEPIPVTNRCWNCYNNGQETALEAGVCPVCGFDKATVYNLELEEARSKQLNAQKG